MTVKYRWVNSSEKELNEMADAGWKVVPGTLRDTNPLSDPSDCYELLMQRDDNPPAAAPASSTGAKFAWPGRPLE